MEDGGQKDRVQPNPGKRETKRRYRAPASPRPPLPPLFVEAPRVNEISN